MSIVYAGLWVGESIYGHYLAESTETTEPKQVSELATNVFTRIDRTYNHRKPFAPYQGIVFSYLVENERAFLCASTEGFPSRTAFSFLDRVKDEYFNGYDGTKRKSEFSKFLKETAILFSDPKADKLRALKEKTDDTIVQMSQNYQNLMTRGQHLDELEDSSNLLREEAQEFEKQAKKLRCKLCRDNLKATVCLTITGIILCVVILVVIFLVVYLVFKPNLNPDSTTQATTVATTSITTTTTTPTTTTTLATTLATTLTTLATTTT